MALFVFCACEKENSIIKDEQLQTKSSAPGRLYNVNVSVENNRLIISCLGENITLQEAYVVGNGGFSVSANFYRQPSVSVTIPGYGYYSIQIKYIDQKTGSQETYVTAYDYSAGGSHEVPPGPSKCQHDFSNFYRNATHTVNGEDISVTVLFTGHFKAVFYPVNVLQGYHREDLTYTYDLTWSGSPVYKTLTLRKSPYASYELRIYSSDCNLPYEQCTHYLRVGVGGRLDVTNEPVWFD